MQGERSESLLIPRRIGVEWWGQGERSESLLIPRRIGVEWWGQGERSESLLIPRRNRFEWRVSLLSCGASEEWYARRAQRVRN